ncbi:dihydropteroate synthase [Salinispirillum marinum]|uniref:Dihydropteroate synthase n=2 Tax=Saccharospirillaceae TaxID=255527 RepID=A0ABV8BJ27_9GAMM
MALRHGSRRLDFQQTRVMGVLNTTPDSFSDGGRYTQPERLAKRITEMLVAGVDVIDVGGESTRPGAQPVSVDEELSRVIPAIEAIRQQSDVWISVDTSTPDVMAAAVAAGADWINDVRALSREGALSMAASLDVPVCLMHMQGQPGTMQQNPEYDDVVAQVSGYLAKRVDIALRAGVKREHIVLDPGFGFGKSFAHNVALFRALPQLLALGFPLLVGVSRKTMLGDITGKPIAQRGTASVAAALLAAQHGVQMVRVHDVDETVDALNVWRALKN